MFSTTFDLAFSGIFLGSMYVLVGVGITLLYGVSQMINLAHGDFMIVGAYFTFALVSALGLAPLWMLLVVPILMGILGMVIYKIGGFSRILNRPISRGDREFTTLIMTFAMTWIVTNLLAAIFTANPQTFPSLTGQISMGTVTIPMRKLVTVAVSLPLVAVIWLLIKKTWIGLSIRCVFDDNEASKLMGINANMVHFLIFFLAFLTAGLGGTLYSMNYAMSPYQGTEFTIIAFVVMIVGGIGSVKGALLAGLVVGLAESFFMFFVSPLLKIAFVYTLFIATLLIKPSGLFKSM
jgi:branched-chain amino acid transport system permease protein